MTDTHSDRALLRCEGLVVGYRGKGLLPPMSFDVRRGSFLTVVGRNGSGKSTLFKTLLGLLPPVAGRVARRPGLRVAYIPQTSGIDPMLPVHARELVQWGRLRGWSFLRPFASRADREARDAALAAAEAEHLSHQPYRELSEGQRQRVLLARVLAGDADLVLLDEPTAAMDAVAERYTLEQLSHLARERGMGVVVVSHELSIPAQLADSVLFLDREGGEVVVGGSREVFTHPAFRRRYGDVISLPG